MLDYNFSDTKTTSWPMKMNIRAGRLVRDEP